MRDVSILSAALCLSAFAAWDDSVSEVPLSWECVVSETRLERGLDLTRVITLRETAAHLEEISIGDIEEVWDWHPIGKPEPTHASTAAVPYGSYQGAHPSGSTHTRHNGHGNYTKGANDRTVSGGDMPRREATSHAASEKKPKEHAEGTRRSYAPHQANDQSVSTGTWHRGHGNYPKGDSDRIVSGGDMPRGETSPHAVSEKRPMEYVEGTRRYSSSSRVSQGGRSGHSSSPARQGDSIDIILGLWMIFGITMCIGIPLYCTLPEEAPRHLFHWGFRLGVLNMSRYALRKDKRIHVESVFQQAIRTGKTEWVGLLLAADWEGKSSSTIALFLVEGLIQQPQLPVGVFRQMTRHLSKQGGIDLNDRLTISDCLHYSASADTACPGAVNAARGTLLDLERKQEKVHGQWGDKYRITWSTQPLLMIVETLQRQDLAQLLLQGRLCSNIALPYQSAMERGEEEKAARLLQYGGSCKVALSDAVRYGVSFSVLSDILRQYLRQGGNIYADLSYNGGGSILHQALFWERHDVVAYLLKEYPDKERYECGAQSSIRFLAATKNSPHLSSIADLPMNWLGKLKNIDQQEEQDLWDKLKKFLAETPYFKAAPYINEKDVNGNSPLGRMVREWFRATEHLHRKQYVTYERNETYLRIYTLLRLGADPNCLYREPRSNEEHTLVYYAAIMGNAPLVDLLASHGAPVLEAYLNKPLIRAVGIKPLLNTWYKMRGHR